MAYVPKYSEPLTIDVLRSVLEYDPDSGDLRWKERPVSMFPDERARNVWNSRFSGKVAFSACCANGYRSGTIFGKTYRGHRLAMALHLGRMLGETEFVDHINGSRSDNRACNMRLVSRSENMRNAKKPCDNTSGVVGVMRRKNCVSKVWLARIGKSVIGSYDTFEEAVAARQDAERRMGYHRNHGR